MNNIANQTLAQIATTQHQAASVFEKYGLDFCCKGKRTLETACLEKGIVIEEVIVDIENGQKNATRHVPFNEMTPEQLISYIMIHHHFYIKQNAPIILEHLQKVAYKHGNRFPYMQDVYVQFYTLQQELLEHLIKEEQILFPRINEICQNSDISINNFPIGYIQAPIHIMESEHNEAGNFLSTIKRLTNNYTVPEGACTTFKVVLAELKEFEEDLHQHIHLENNILFPLATKIISSKLN